MRVISKKNLKIFWEKFPEVEEALKAWNAESEKANWQSHNDLKNQFKSASIINKKRVVFNIKGNKYRLIVDIEYKIQLVFVVWIGNHKDYNNINVKEIKYVKTNKK